MSKVSQTSKEYFKAISLLGIALVASQVLFGVIFIFVFGKVMVLDKTAKIYQIALYIIPAVTVVALFAAYKYYQYRLNLLKEESDLIVKMTKYRSLLVTRFGIMEIPSFLTIIAFRFVHIWIYIIIPVLIICMMIYLLPNKDKIISELELNPNEISTIENPDAIIAEIERNS
jgi:hypothetical protein